MSAIPGDPGLLRERADDLARSAGLIARTAAGLRALGIEGRAEALDGLRARSVETATRLDAAHDRYAGAAAALQAYAVRLRSAQQRADLADLERAAAQGRERTAREAEEALRRAYRTLEDADAPAGPLESAREDWLGAGQGLRREQEAAAAATAAIAAARAEVEDAAEAAIRAIDAATADTDDRLWDGLGRGLDAIGDRLAEAAGPADRALREILGDVATALETVAAVLLPIVAGLLESAVPAIGAEAAVASAPVLGLLAAAVVVAAEAVLLWEFTRPPLDVRPLEEGHVAGGADRATAYRRAVANGRAESRGLLDLSAPMETVDRIGGDDAAVIDIRRAGGEPPRWVVTLPSSQGWLGGSPNDWPHNVPLKLWPPELPTAYERAVVGALREAGVGPDDRVMVQGFSQGGIMAARLAANPRSGVNVTAVLAVGAPVQSLDIPAVSRTGDPVSVVTIRHAGDPVPMLDLPPGVGERQPHRHDFREPDPEGARGSDAHSAELYRDTLRRVTGRHPEIDALVEDYAGAPTAHRLVRVTE